MTSHLYAVDPEGQVSASGPADTGEPSEPGGPTGSRRSAPKARPKYPVPTDRLKLDKQKEALRVICTASRNGQEPVDAEKMASLMGLVPATAALNNAFFVSVGLLKKVGKGDYLPTQRALDFQQKWSFNKAEAPKILAPAFVGSWFFDAVKQKLEISQTTRDQMIETLAAVAYTDNSYATQYGFLLDWLEYVGLIKTDGGIVTLIDSAAVEPEPEPEPEEQEPIAPRANGTPPKPADPITPAPVRDPAIVSFTMDVQVTAEDLASLTPEQITALFEGVGKVAAIKAALAKG